MRYRAQSDAPRVDVVYVKNGDVVDQYARAMSADEADLQSGPDAFLFDFLRVSKSTRTLILSIGKSDHFSQISELLWLRTYRRKRNSIVRVFERPMTFARAFFALWQARPKRVLCGSTGELLWACSLYSVLTSAPVVHSRHNRVSVGEGSFLRRFAVALDNACIRRTIAVICHGPYLRQEILELGYPADSVYEFDVRLERFRARAELEGAASMGNSDRRTTILYTGRIEPLKGVFDLLHALEGLLRERTNVVLLYVGEGAAADELTARVRELDLDERVKLLGRLPHHALATLMKRSYLVVTPTRSRFVEGRCMAAMESLAVGTPVVAPDFGPFPFLVKHKINGLLYVPDSIEDLRDNLTMALEDRTVYDRIRSGASKTADKLLVPPLTFGQAVERAFGAVAGDV